jgi:hypothetical protein
VEVTADAIEVAIVALDESGDVTRSRWARNPRRT